MDKKTAEECLSMMKIKEDCKERHMRFLLAVAGGMNQAQAYRMHIAKNKNMSSISAAQGAHMLLSRDHPEYRLILDKIRADILGDEIDNIKIKLAKAAKVGIKTATSQVLNDGEHKHFANTLNTILKSTQDYVAPTPPPTNNIQVNIDNTEVKGAQDILDSLDSLDVDEVEDQNEPDPETL